MSSRGIGDVSLDVASGNFLRTALLTSLDLSHFRIVTGNHFRPFGRSAQPRSAVAISLELIRLESNQHTYFTYSML
jgi:hypothetical protein